MYTEPQRGERVVRSGSIGYYIGTSPAGIEWIWWGDPKASNADELFSTMCRQFDILEKFRKNIA